MSFYGKSLYVFTKLFNKVRFKNTKTTTNIDPSKINYNDDIIGAGVITADEPWDILNWKAANHWLYYTVNNDTNSIELYHNYPATRASTATGFELTSGNATQLKPGAVFSTDIFDFDEVGHFIDKTSKNFKLPPLEIRLDATRVVVSHGSDNRLHFQEDEWITLNTNNDQNQLIFKHKTYFGYKQTVNPFEVIENTGDYTAELVAGDLIRFSPLILDEAGHSFKPDGTSEFYYYQLPFPKINLANGEIVSGTYDNRHLIFIPNKWIELDKGEKSHQLTINHKISDIDKYDTQGYLDLGVIEEPDFEHIVLKSGSYFSTDSIQFDEAGHATAIERIYYKLPLMDIEADISDLQDAVGDITSIYIPFMDGDKAVNFIDLSATIGQVNGENGYSIKIANIKNEASDTVYSISDALITICDNYALLSMTGDIESAYSAGYDKQTIVSTIGNVNDYSIKVNELIKADDTSTLLTISDSLIKISNHFSNYLTTDITGTLDDITALNDYAFEVDKINYRNEQNAWFVKYNDQLVAEPTAAQWETVLGRTDKDYYTISENLIEIYSALRGVMGYYPTDGLSADEIEEKEKIYFVNACYPNRNISSSDNNSYNLIRAIGPITGANGYSIEIANLLDTSIKDYFDYSISDSIKALCKSVINNRQSVNTINEAIENITKYKLVELTNKIADLEARLEALEEASVTT